MRDNQRQRDEQRPIEVGLFEIRHIEARLQDIAAERETCSYSELLLFLGHRFTRPKMRALCKVLDEIDRRAEGCGEPELAALVVRESDGLPGQGWWIGRRDHVGEWVGAVALAYVAAVQARAFEYWMKGSDCDRRGKEL